MKLDIVNAKNEKVGALELNDDVFGGRVNTGVIWESVVQLNAAERRGTHATKNRALVSGGGKKPYKQKGTGRPQLNDGAVVVVDALDAGGRKTKAAAEMFKRLGVAGKTLVIDVNPAEDFVLSARNLAGVRLVPSGRVTARDIMDTAHVVTTREALEKLQESLG
jgi:large subunit ribosomal protein L4